jgi:hypothetical protein
MIVSKRATSYPPYPVATMLTGTELLTKYKDLQAGNASRTEICTALGYTTTTTSGKTKLLWNSLQSALLDASGVSMPTGRSGGPRPSFTTRVLTTNKTVVVGKCYVEMLGVDPGAQFEITVDQDTREIILSLPE